MKGENMKNNDSALTTRMVVSVGMLSAIATILMLFDIPIPFAPSFYKIDFSELPALIGAFAYGPLAGVLIELVKVLLKVVIKGTSTKFVGEIANFAVGCSLIVPAGVIYGLKKTKKQAVIGCVAGTLVMAVFGAFFNAVYLLPKFAEMYGMDLSAIIAMGAAVNPLIGVSVLSFVAACVAPLNFVKGGLVSLVTMFIYKPLSPILKRQNG